MKLLDRLRQRASLSSRKLTDVPEAVRIGSPHDAPDGDVKRAANRGVLLPQTNFAVVYRVAFGPVLKAREQPITMRFVFLRSALIDNDAFTGTPTPSQDNGAWLLLTSLGLRWHFWMDGVPGTPPNAEAPRPPGPRLGVFADLRLASLPRTRVTLGAGPFGPGVVALYGFHHHTTWGKWLHVIGLSPGSETNDLMAEVKARIERPD